MSTSKTCKQKMIAGFMSESIDISNSFATAPNPLDFVIPGFVAGTVGCWAAAGATGKSFGAIEAAMCVASASADAALLKLGIEKHGKVAIFNAEDPDVVLHQRLHSISQYLDKSAQSEIAENVCIKALSGRGGDIMDEVWFDEILRTSTGCRLVIFDTFSRWHRMSENDNGEMAQVVGQFERLARATGASVLFLHHVNKSSAVNGKQDEQQSSRGAASITDNVRWQCFMQTMSEKEALKFGIPDSDRKRFVRFGDNKPNYGQSTGDKWLERCDGGVLLPVDFAQAKPAKRVSKGGFKDEV